MKKVFYGWDGIEAAIANLTEQIITSKFKPDLILSIGRGGMIPSRLLSDSLNVSDICMLNAKMYTGIGTRNQEPRIGAITSSIYKKNILLVDDIIDTGLTIDAVIKQIDQLRATSFRVATIDVKEHVKRKPSYYFSIVKEEDWIVYPWELHSES